VAFNSVTLQPANGTAIVVNLDETDTINLLDYQGDNRAMLLDGFSLPAGNYNWIRLGVSEDPDDTYIVTGGHQYTLDAPSLDQTGLKMNRGFTITAGGTSDFTIDFDLRKSVHETGSGDYKLRPTVRLEDNSEVATLSGTVALVANCDDATGNAVYLFEGADIIPQDIQGNDGDPFATASANYNADTNKYDFEIGFVPFGDYTVAFTCDAESDDMYADDSATVAFVVQANTSIIDGNGAVVDLVE